MKPEVTASNWEHWRKRMNARLVKFRRRCARRGIKVYTELTPEQLVEDKRDEVLCWPSRCR